MLVSFEVIEVGAFTEHVEEIWFSLSLFFFPFVLFFTVCFVVHPRARLSPSLFFALVLDDRDNPFASGGAGDRGRDSPDGGARDSRPEPDEAPGERRSFSSIAVAASVFFLYPLASASAAAATRAQRGVGSSDSVDRDHHFDDAALLKRHQTPAPQGPSKAVPRCGTVRS